MANMSRRSFVELVTGTIVSLPVLAGGLLLVPRMAQAEEDATDADELAGRYSQYTIIDVVQPWEVGVQVVDITKPEKVLDDQGKDTGMVKYPPVEGATVTITSRFNSQTTTGTSDSYGFVNIDVRDLCVVEDGQDKNNLDEYWFNGSISVSCDGFREFHTALIVVEGGSGLQVPAHPSAEDAGKPWPHSVSFDEWDVLYIANEFVVTSENTGDHTISAEFRDISWEVVEFQLWVGGEHRQSVTAEVVSGTATASFTAPFLKAGDAAAIPAGASLEMRLCEAKMSTGATSSGVTSAATSTSATSAGTSSAVATSKDSGTTYGAGFAGKTTAGTVDKPTGQQGKELSPINVNDPVLASSTLAPKWPGKVPILSGSTLKVWIPALPIGIYVNPFGYVQISLKSPQWGYRYDNGKYATSDDSAGESGSDSSGSTERKVWGTFPRQSVKQQWDKICSERDQMMGAARSAYAKPGAIQQVNFAEAFSASMNFQLLAAAKWDSDTGIFQGEIAGQILLAFGFSISETFMAGPIPVLITFSLDTSLDIGLTAACSSSKANENEKMVDVLFDFSRWEWDYSNTGFSMTLNVMPSLSVGVGLRGVASISVKGTITLTTYLGVPFKSEGKPSPHFTAGWSAQVLLVIQAFIFTQSFPLYTTKFSNFYDSWDETNGVKAQGDGMALDALADMSMNDLLGQLVPVTDDMLRMTSEASISAQSLTAQARLDVVDWKATRQEAEGQLEDGTPMHYVVYDLSGTLAAEGGEAPEAAEGTEALEAAGDTEALEADVTWLAPMANAERPSLGVADIGAQGGIRPSLDVRVFGTDESHVFGDPRTRLLNLWQAKGTWCFRLAAVEVGGAMRTRVIATCIDGTAQGTSRVIDFDTGIDGMPHDALYDYSFAVVAGSGSEPVYSSDGTTIGLPSPSSAIQEITVVGDTAYDFLQLVIVSGTRQGDGTTLADAATDLVFTFMTIQASEFPGTSDVLKPSQGSGFSQRGSEVLDYQSDWYHSIISVQITTIWAQDIAICSAYSTITFLDRCAPKADDALGEAAEVRVGLLLNKWNPLQGSQVVRDDRDSLNAAIGGIGDRTVYEQMFYPNSTGGLLMLRGANATHYVLLEIHYGFDFKDLTNLNYLRSVKRCKDYDPAIRLVARPGTDYYLTSYPDDPAQLDLEPDQRDYTTWTLHKAQWSDDATPELKVEPIGPSGFNVVNFGFNPQGSFLFWPQSREVDDDRVWDADGKEDVKVRPALYQIMACRIRGERFSDPFVVADLPTDTDMLTVPDMDQNAVVELMRTEYKDTGSRDDEGRTLYHAADIWYTAIPGVRCVTATACEATNPFVNPGGKATFHVAVRNDGNTFLSGCTLKLCACKATKDDGTADETYAYVEGAETQVSFKDAIQESAYNPLDEEGKLKSVEDDFALAPGKTSLYAATVSFPSTWGSGEWKVLFVATDGVLAPDPGLAAQANEPEPIEYHVEPGAYKVVQVRTAPDHVHDPDRRHMDVIVVGTTVAEGSPFSPTPVRELGKEGTADNNNAPVRRPKLPNTGDDPTAGTGLLGAGLAAAGTAVALYERRRAENE